MSATICGIAYKSVCDIKKTLALPNVKLSEWSYDGTDTVEKEILIQTSSSDKKTKS